MEKNYDPEIKAPVCGNIVLRNEKILLHDIGI